MKCLFDIFYGVIARSNNSFGEQSLNPLINGGGGDLVFSPLLKISYLKILDLANVFVADSSIKHKKKIFVSPSPRALEIWF